MNPRPAFDPSYNRLFGKPVLAAIKRYGMIRPGDAICVALSGGMDSTALLFMLDYVRRSTDRRFDLSAAHIKTGDYDTGVLAEYCASLGVPYYEDRLHTVRPAPKKNACSICSRLKRGALARLLRKHGLSRAAFGHHADDVAETFLMNLLQNRKLGSFSPVVDLGPGTMVIIRPLIYLAKEDVRRVFRRARLRALDFECPHAGKNFRASIRPRLAELNALLGVKDFSRRLVAALENVDMPNIWHTRD